MNVEAGTKGRRPGRHSRAAQPNWILHHLNAGCCRLICLTERLGRSRVFLFLQATTEVPEHRGVEFPNDLAMVREA
jgi:hypothetical protein